MVAFAFTNRNKIKSFMSIEIKEGGGGGGEANNKNKKSLKACIALLAPTTAGASSGNVHVCPCVTVNQLSSPTQAGESTRTKGQSRKGSNGRRGESYQATKKARQHWPGRVHLCGEAMPEEGQRDPGTQSQGGRRR